MGHRKTPSLHIRFDGFNSLDKLENWANSRGKKIVPWARQALLMQARKQQAQEVIDNRANLAVLEMLLLLRGLSDPAAAQAATREAKNYFEKVRRDAEIFFD